MPSPLTNEVQNFHHTAVTASVTIGTLFAITFIVYTSPELGIPGILATAAIAVTALWQLRQ